MTPVDIGADAGNFVSAGDTAPPRISYSTLLTLQALGVQGRHVYQLTGGSLGVDREPPDTPCRIRLGAEFQYRRYPDALAFNGHYAGGLVQPLCGDGWLFRLRAGQDVPEYDNRPGGQQSRIGVLAVRQMLRGRQRLNLEVDAEHQQDARGFSPLLESNLKRRVNKTPYRIEYTYLGGRVEPFVGAEWLRQQSNLPLYAVDTRIVYAGRTNYISLETICPPVEAPGAGQFVLSLIEIFAIANIRLRNRVGTLSFADRGKIKPAIDKVIGEY